MPQMNNIPEWALRCFPYPQVTASVCMWCGCTWTYSPDITRSHKRPWILKVPWRNCRRHNHLTTGMSQSYRTIR